MTRSAFRERVAAAQANRSLIEAVRLTTLRKVAQRTTALAELRNADELRTAAAGIKRRTIDNLGTYLAQFVAAVQARGGVVHFAQDAADARATIREIARQRGLRHAVKAKSMTTEEIELNPALAAEGVDVVETDLGEFIVQIDHDRPSHIITPIIHKNRRQVADALARELGVEVTDDPTELTAVARAHLREKFRHCDLGITGVNFAVAETGTLCLLTNEGNGRMTVSRPRVHVALLGIEKLIPRLSDLPVFLKLISRSTTGQPLGVYTTLITGPRRPGDADGPAELHVVLLDNGRSDICRGAFREVLSCIRCGACLNACPVYRNVGGHAYNSVYPGPIGSVLTPLLAGLQEHAELPRASSLCGACEQACPLKIDIPDLLVRLRAHSQATQPHSKRIAFRLWSRLMRSPRLYRLGQWLLQRAAGRNGRLTRGFGPLSAWTLHRDLPIPNESFRQRWQRLSQEPPDAQ